MNTSSVLQAIKQNQIDAIRREESDKQKLIAMLARFSYNPDGSIRGYPPAAEVENLLKAMK